KARVRDSASCADSFQQRFIRLIGKLLKRLRNLTHRRADRCRERRECVEIERVERCRVTREQRLQLVRRGVVKQLSQVFTCERECALIVWIVASSHVLFYAEQVPV